MNVFSGMPENSGYHKIDIIMYRFHWIIALFLVGTSCSKQEFNTMMVKQDSDIERYADTFADSLVTVTSGVWRITKEKGDGGVVAARGDSIVFNYKAHLFSSGPGHLFDTNISEDGIAAGFGHELHYYTPRKSVVGRGNLLDGLDRGLAGAAKGERLYVVFSARYGFGNVQTAMVPKNSPLIYEVWILDVKKN